MPPVFETGHYKNVTSFDTMIQKALGMAATTILPKQLLKSEVSKHY